MIIAGKLRCINNTSILSTGLKLICNISQPDTIEISSSGHPVPAITCSEMSLPQTEDFLAHFMTQIFESFKRILSARLLKGALLMVSWWRSSLQFIGIRGTASRMIIHKDHMEKELVMDGVKEKIQNWYEDVKIHYRSFHSSIVHLVWGSSSIYLPLVFAY
jgi:hypothetical protein